jgi:hypothetical protein
MTLRQNEDESWTAFAEGKQATHQVRRQAVSDLVGIDMSQNCGRAT